MPDTLQAEQLWMLQTRIEHIAQCLEHYAAQARNLKDELRELLIDAEVEYVDREVMRRDRREAFLAEAISAAYQAEAHAVSAVTAAAAAAAEDEALQPARTDHAAPEVVDSASGTTSSGLTDPDYTGATTGSLASPRAP